MRRGTCRFGDPRHSAVGATTFTGSRSLRNESFAPKERWRSWSAGQLERFDWLAGEQLRDLGYTNQAAPTSRTRSMKHVLLDWRWSVGRSGGLAIYRTRVRLALRRRLGLLRET